MLERGYTRRRTLPSWNSPSTRARYLLRSCPLLRRLLDVQATYLESIKASDPISSMLLTPAENEVMRQLLRSIPAPLSNTTRDSRSSRSSSTRRRRRLRHAKFMSALDPQERERVAGLMISFRISASSPPSRRTTVPGSTALGARRLSYSKMSDPTTYMDVPFYYSYSTDTISPSPLRGDTLTGRRATL